jgi:exopolyphosphatase/guanosine-5'-triphosphate,3'-diphosphate pyrophosphatase
VDTLLPAAMVFRILLELLQKSELTICDKAIREGIIYDFIQRHHERIKAERDIPDVRRRNILALAHRCHVSETHALHVAGLALRLFDQTKVLHGFGQREREWLECSAILHDIGYMINSRQHHKHAYYLIKNSDLSGFTAEEIDLIANIARYHRRSVPTRKHDEFTALPEGSQRVINVLSALLRIADGLDRSQFSVVQNIDVKIGKTVLITAQVSGDAELEIWAARGRSDLFEKVFKRPVQFITTTRDDEAT